MLKRLNALTWTPEFNVVLFALLLNYPWEFLQVPLFDRMPQGGPFLSDAQIQEFADWILEGAANN